MRGLASSCNQQRSRAGFSLLELMAVMLLMFIMMGIATTAFRGIMRGAGLRGATAVVRGTLTQARQQAMTQGRPVSVIIEQDGNEEGTMLTVMSFGPIWAHLDGDVIEMENDMPWSAEEIAGARAFNLAGDSTTLASDSDIADSHIYFRAPGLGSVQDELDHLAFQVGTLRELHSGLRFELPGGDRLIIIFDADGTAIQAGDFSVVERGGGGGFSVEVDSVSGRIRVGDID